MATVNNRIEKNAECGAEAGACAACGGHVISVWEDAQSHKNQS